MNRYLMFALVALVFTAIADPPAPVGQGGWGAPADTSRKDTAAAAVPTLPADTAAPAAASPSDTSVADTMAQADTVAAALPAVPSDTVSTLDTLTALPALDIGDPEIAKFWNVRELAPGVYACLSASTNRVQTHAGFVATDSGVVVIDGGGGFGQARALASAVRAVAGKPIVAVVLTSCKPERLVGLQWLLEGGAQLWASAAGADAMPTAFTQWLTGQKQKLGIQVRRTADPAARAMLESAKAELDSVVVPTVARAFTGEVDLFGLTLAALAGSHPGDAAVFVPKGKVLFAGELATPGVVRPVSSAVWPDWIAAVKKLRDYDPDVVVSVVGPVGRGSGLKDFEKFLSTLYGEVKKMKGLGATIEDTVAAVLKKLSKFDGWAGFADHMQKNVEEVYRAVPVE